MRTSCQQSQEEVGEEEGGRREAGGAAPREEGAPLRGCPWGEGAAWRSPQWSPAAVAAAREGGFQSQERRW